MDAPTETGSSEHPPVAAPTAGSRTENPSPARPPAGHGTRALAVAVVVALLAGLAAWIALTPLPGRPSLAPWVTVQADGYRIDLPAPPTSATVAFGAGHVTTAVDGDNAFTVVWIPAQAGVDPTVLMSRALQALQKEPATITLTRPGLTGPFPSAEVAARLPSAYLHGRLIVVGRRTYLVAEITPGEAVPPELIRLLTGFDPDPTAA